ncbi:MAG TPA: membrane protein insertase YidC, partial [Candidatus Angelobacter sp.]|nr:membrane protein insertase YidC [Candidatus Angelobacter sp.]
VQGAVSGGSAGSRAGAGAADTGTSAGGATGAPGTAGSTASTGTLSSGTILTSPQVAPAPTEIREIRTEHYRATFTSDGAAISHWILDSYKDEVRNQPIDLVPPGARAYQVIVEAGSRALDFSEAPFRLTQDDPLGGILSFEAQDVSGVRVTKTFRLGSDRRLLDASVRVSAPPELGPIRYRIGWGTPLPITEPSTKRDQLQAVALLGTKLEMIPASKLGPNGERIVPPGNVRWVAGRSKYFIAAVIPDSGTVSEVVFRSAGPGLVTAWLLGAAPPGGEVLRHTRVYGGPIHYETLAAVGAGLDEVANLGWRWLRGVSVLLLKCLNLVYKMIPNYGVAIIILAAATKLLFYPLTQSSLRSMKVMHHLQPQIKELQEKHKNDPMKLNQAMMALYKENKVNPMSGCLPMLLQVPVFIGLYNILLYSIELRASGFIGYIHDLSAPDVLMTIGGLPIHLMPMVMTGSTYLLQSQTPVAPAQKGMMYVMPLFMLFFMYSFPSGVVLYWTVNNLLSALQQYLVNLAEDRKMAAPN